MSVRYVGDNCRFIAGGCNFLEGMSVNNRKLFVKIMKKLLFLFAGLYLSAGLYAAEVDTARALTVARNFLTERLHVHKGVPPAEMRLRLTEISKSADTVLFYVYNVVGQKGFVLLSADDRMLPVLAYSFESSFGDTADMPPALKEWLAVTERQIRVVLKEHPAVPAEVKKAWQHYLAPGEKGTAVTEDVAPLLTTKWNQGRYYNQLCPADPKGQDGHVWVGCVAVAMAQVMKYWNYPEYGSGEHSYDHYIYGLQTADFANTRYEWSGMPDALSDYNTPVATLMYHCGVSVNMNYGTYGSTAYMSSTGTALKGYFDYSREITSVSKWRYTDHAWDSLVRSQIDLGQPLIYAGGSHAFNIDGYQDTSYFHVNWGWGGAYNGYFYLDDLTPGSSDFTSGQQAVINIRPDCGEAPTETDTLTGQNGKLWDNGGFNGNYYNCSDSRTLLMPEGAVTVQVKFNYFSTVAGQDSLYIHDGTDEKAPVLAAISGDTVPDPFVSTGNALFLHFVSDGYTTGKGYEIQYTCAFDDAGVTQMLLPQSRTCGSEDDSLVVVVKNFGIHSQAQIPVKVEVMTPRGEETYTATLQETLAPDEQDTLYVGMFSTLEPGEYSFTCYTTLPGDTLINDNDTSYATVQIKFLQPVPYYENVDDMGWDLGDWTNRGSLVWINGNGGSRKNDNAYFSGMAGGGDDQFFFFDRKITGVTQHTGMYFDYRILGGQDWPPAPDTLRGEERLHVIVARGCGYAFDTVFTIDKTNHVPDSLFRRVYVPLGAYADDEIMIGFTTEWDSVWSTIDYDNILVADSIRDNRITETTVCEGDGLVIAGTAATGGVGPLTYVWEESDDGVSWRVAANSGNTPVYTVALFDTPLYFRRIVRDTLLFADTSNVVHIAVISWPVPAVSADTAVCVGTTVTLTATGGESYHWNTGETTPVITVTPLEDTKYTVVVTNGGQCATDTSVTVTVHPLPQVSLGPDTTSCTGSSVTLDAGDFESYLWNTGATGRTLTVDTAGDYRVTVTNVYGCENSDTLRVQFETCTGVDDFGKATVKIYPNPSAGIFYIEGLPAKGVERITVMNVLGGVVKTIVPEEEIIRIDLQDQPEGIYFIRFVRKDETSPVYKVMKKR